MTGTGLLPAVRRHWGLDGELVPLQDAPGSKTWRLGDHVVKLTRDDLPHVQAGLLASEAVERDGITAGAAARTRDGQLCVPLTIRQRPWALLVMRHAAGEPLSLHAVTPAALGGLLGRLHRVLRDCPAAGGWTPQDVLGHMTNGVSSEQPEPVRQLITTAVSDVRAWYAGGPALQLLRGDGPEMLSRDGAEVSAVIDWGGVRAGSVADDIGCWTAHGATDQVPLPDYTAAFLASYRTHSELSAAEAAAVPLFQRLRIASRACYVTDPGALAGVTAWLRAAFSP